MTASPAIKVQAIVTGPLQENAYLVADQAGQGFLIDPGDDAGEILAALEKLPLRPQAIVLTHAHFDHVGAVQPLREQLGIPVWVHRADLELYRQAGASAARWGLAIAQPAEPDHFLTQDQELAAGKVRLRVRELPGHAPGHVVLLGPGFVLAGDTLFQGSVGRTDLPGGNHAELIAGINRELLSLPGDTLVFPGHGGSTTVGAERTSNPFLL